jgi:hypothetical protein
MSAHRRHLITRNADGFFWCGLLLGWSSSPTDAQIFDSIITAYRNCELVPDQVTVDPADWYLPDSILKPLECSA